jgi:hypothetical protein
VAVLMKCSAILFQRRGCGCLAVARRNYGL